MPKRELKELLKRKEVESLLKISRSQIYNFLKSGRLRAYKIGGTLRFQREDVDKLIELHPYIQTKREVQKISKTAKEKPLSLNSDREQKEEAVKRTVSKNSFAEARKLSENLDLNLDSQEEKYKIGNLITLDFKDFAGANPHVIVAKLKHCFSEALQTKFSLSPEELEEILNQTDYKFKEFGRKIFIQNIQHEGSRHSVEKL